jgi:hypothetical protein
MEAHVMSTEQKKKSPWLYVGIGCLVAVALLIIGVVGVGYFGYRYARQMAEDIKDPVAREAKVKAVLGARDIPSGYFPVLGLSIPFVMETAILSDREGIEGDGPSFDQRGFIYVNMLGGSQQQELRDFFEGKSTESSILRQQSVSVRAGDIIRRGEIKDTERRVLYVAQRGTVEMRKAEVKGVTTLLLVECPGDTRARLGIWFGPDPDPSAPVKSADFKGSPADEDEIRTFLGNFNFCRKQ